MEEMTVGLGKTVTILRATAIKVNIEKDVKNMFIVQTFVPDKTYSHHQLHGAMMSCGNNIETLLFQAS